VELFIGEGTGEFEMGLKSADGFLRFKKKAARKK
jgi:hypothetical protein